MGMVAEAQAQGSSPDAEVEACTKNKPFLLIKEQCFDASSMAREQRWHFSHFWYIKKPHFLVCRANGYEVSTAVVNYPVLVWSG